ncbi:GspH/FimT family pseudopilin [Vandammella animalimorsus]|uniref:GspH/FimT family pseudopilin n=1 Tax=Vandammella animalimorsus TaxID=2029117 RepID=UPI001EEF4774|nr:GspH/FimT family pseudopilin [Vandammella animalimorsus]
MLRPVLHLAPWPRALRRRQRGFTLIELLVVIAIAGLMAALVPLAYTRIHEGAQYRDAVRSLWTSLRTLRDEAYSSGTVTHFTLDLRSRQFNLGPRSYTLPEGLELRTTVAELDPQAGREVAAIWFLPEGGSTGGSIELLRPNGDGTRLRVDWLTGDITQEPLLP